MQATAALPALAFPRASSVSPPAVSRRPAEEPCDKAELTGQILGGAVAGAGLGYLGLELGMRWGLEYGMSLMGPHPAMQVLGLLTFGLQYGVLASALGGAVGATTGVLLGGWLGGKAANAISG
jgi:hypothetical protein